MRVRTKGPVLLLLGLVSLFFLAPGAPAMAQDGHDHGHRPGVHSGHHGRWWDNPHLDQKIGLTDAQKSRMDAIFEQHKPKLKRLNDTLKKDEKVLHPLLGADHLDEHKVLHQIDVIAQARANLEKANARMLFDLRKQLTPEQWKKLQEAAREWRAQHRDHDHDHAHSGGPPPNHQGSGK